MPDEFEQLKQVGGRYVLAGRPTVHRAKSIPTQQLVIRTTLDVSSAATRLGTPQ